jgi:hypothetical protein
MTRKWDPSPPIPLGGMEYPGFSSPKALTKGADLGANVLGRAQGKHRKAGCGVPRPSLLGRDVSRRLTDISVPSARNAKNHRGMPSQLWHYAVARCSWPANLTLTTFDTPGSCMVTP